MKMTTSILTRANALFFLLATLGSAAQAQNSQHHHYKVIDIGTFGGNFSGTDGPASPSLNQFGMSVGAAQRARWHGVKAAKKTA